MSNVAINILTTLSLIWLVGLIVAVVIRIAVMAKNRDTARLYGFLKGFKKGSCFLVYFAAVPLYFCAFHFCGESVGYSLFTAVEESIGLIVLSFDYGVVSALAEANAYFAAVIYICFITVILNAVLFAVSLAGMRLLNRVYRGRALRQNGGVYILVGFNGENAKIARSVPRGAGKKGGYSVVFVSEADIRKKDELNLLMLENRAAYIGFSDENFGALLEKLVARRRLWNKKSVNIIINTGDACQNLLLTGELKKFIDGHPEISHSILNNSGVNGYVFCRPKDVSTFNYYVENTHGAIQYVNKYRLIAMDFIGKYPLTKFMTDEIDAEYPALKKDAEVNFVMIGFGKLCRQIFHTSVSTQQFVAVEDGKIVEKPVHYCIYDKLESDADVVLNHNYYRYENFVKMNAGREREFLPFPEPPADVQFHKMNICDREFYHSLYSDLNGANKYSYVVVSYGTDMENLDFGQKLAAKFREWNLQGKIKLFVKIRDGNLVKDGADDGIIFFGDESSTVYNIGVILHEEIEELAKRRSLLYSQESQKNLGGQALEISASKKWYSQSQCQRESNVYACLSLRPKLNLLGFDIRRQGEGADGAAAEFREKYERGDKIRTGREFSDGRKEVVYNNGDFDRLSARKILAYTEHQRWNANYISWGYVPATISEIAESDANGKDADIRRHGCLTTFEGLKEFREIAARKTIDFYPGGELSAGQQAAYQNALEAADVIRYDYQIMDDVLWLLEKENYEIVKK